jgi:hypothetical protein
MKPIRVTFDSNAWEVVVSPGAAHKNHSCLLKIKEALEDGRLKGFICETLGTLEAIKRSKRADYFANRKPKSDIQIERVGTNPSVTITFKTDHSLHPGLDKRLTDKLQEARAIGMLLLSAPRLNIPLPSHFRNDPTFYEPQVFSSGAYNERFGDAAAAIEARGVGGAVVAAIAKRIEHRFRVNGQTPSGSQFLAYAEDEAERKEIEKAIAEWADGDLVASHIGSENDLLCTEDRAKSAGGPSVFDTTNRAWLSAAYGVKIVTIADLAVRLVECESSVGQA